MGSREKTGPFATPLYRRPDDLLVVDLAVALSPSSRANACAAASRATRWCRTTAARATREAPGARRPRNRVDRQRARRVPARGAGLGPRSANDRRDDPPAVRRSERPSVPLDRQISRRPGRHAARTGEHARDPRLARGESAAPARSARQQSERGVLPRSAARRCRRSDRKASLGVPLTAGRSIAIDAKFLPLGAPMFLSTSGAGHGPAACSVSWSRRIRAARSPARCAPICSSVSAPRPANTPGR